MNALRLSLRIVYLLTLVCSTCSMLQAQLPPGFIRTPLATGLNPTSIVSAPDGRIFITEKHGTIRILRDGQMLEAPLLQIEVDNSNERGLGHMVLHPDFDQNGFYYVFYAVPGMGHNRVSRFTANGDNTIPGSEVVILELDPLGGEVHNGGDMVFGFDGYLYISTGDGGQNWNGENLGSTNGKILRVDDQGQPAPDNPFVTLNYLRADHVYAYGFRNPFTMTIHPVTGAIFANDVGGSKYEEVNVVEWGRFYGWPKVEGKRTVEVVPSEYKDPLFQYTHTNNYCAIVGSAFYFPEVQQFPDTYAGKYFYSDYCTGQIRILDPETGVDKGAFITDGDRVVDLEVTPDGSLYYLERRGLGDGSPEDNTETSEGILWKVIYTGSGAPFISAHPNSVLHVVGEDAHFSVGASGAVPLTYTWLVNGEPQSLVTGPDLVLHAVTLEMDSTLVQVMVSNAEGTVASAEVLLLVTANQRPIPQITSPSAGTLYRGGAMLSFSGFAQDPEEGQLTSGQLSFKIDFHHGTHTHPAMSWTQNLTSGTFEIPVIGETSTDVWYRIYLKATDSQGLSNTTFTDVFPERGVVSVLSQPGHLLIHLDGAPEVTPYTFEGVSGISRHITAPYKQVKGDSVYFFREWTDGITQVNREVKTSDADQTFTGRYDGIANGKGTGLTAYYYDNPQFSGEPVAVALDSILDHQFLHKAPYPGLPEDHFGIVWKGFIQPLRSGVYHFTVFADDGVFVEIGGHVIIEQWKPGVHRETGEMYLEAGRLYPVHIRFYEFLFGAQLKFRWSTDDFPEEVVPTAQLYPEDYLTAPDVSSLIGISQISGDVLRLKYESFKTDELLLMITTATGIEISQIDYPVQIGLNESAISIAHLPAGWYYLSGVLRDGTPVLKTPFIKLR